MGFATKTEKKRGNKCKTFGLLAFDAQGQSELLFLRKDTKCEKFTFDSKPKKVCKFSVRHNVCICIPVGFVVFALSWSKTNTTNKLRKKKKKRY